MSSFSRLPSRHFGPSAPCLMSVMVLMWIGNPSPSEGSCGDHLFSHNGSQSMAIHGLMSPQHSIPRMFRTYNSHKAPCSGPACRHAPNDSGKVPPSHVQTSESDRTLLASVCRHLNDTRIYPWSFTNAPLILEDHRPSLDRPPRSN